MFPTTCKFPSPVELGLPAKFDKWRPNQIRAVEDGLESQKRFIGQVQRTGAGKSLTYVAQAVVSKSRAMILTSTKGLQDQLLQDFESVGIKDLRGKSSYQCECLSGHTCEEGSIGKCLYKGSTMCPHAAAKQAVMDSQIATTNYSCWIASNRYSNGLGAFDMLVLDEAHNAPDALNKAMQVRLSENEIYGVLKQEWPVERDDMLAWKHWALVTQFQANLRLQSLKEAIEKSARPKPSVVKEFKALKNITRKLADVGNCKPEKWVIDEWDGGYQFDPVDASEYGEKILFRGIPKVLLVSGTIRPHTLEMLGIEQEHFDFFDYPSDNKVSKSPLIYIPTIRVWRHSQEWELKRLVKRIDEIVESRFDRKGIIHTVSFKLRDFIMSNSKFSQFFISNYAKEGDATSFVVERFRRMKAPAVLVSPSVTTGYDFPYDAARYQIIAKLAWPDGRAKVDQERKRRDPKRDAYHVMQTIAQAFGRGDRAEDDWQEVFVIDDSMEKFFWRYQELAPSWLPAYYRKMTKVPDPMELTA